MAKVGGRNQFDALVAAQLPIQSFAIVGPVPDHFRGDFWEESLLKGGFDEFGFMRRSADGDRETMAVEDRHDCTAFSLASRADSRAHFLALEKLASSKVSNRSSLPRSRTSLASAVSTPVRMPSRRHC